VRVEELDGVDEVTITDRAEVANTPSNGSVHRSSEGVFEA